MKCEHAEMMMAELLAGEIRPDGRAALEAHLVECAACRADFAVARAGFRVDWPETPPPARLVESTRALFREPQTLLRFLRFGTAAAASFAAALLILLSGGGKSAPAADPPPMAAPMRLASIQEAVVGTLVAKDEEGRPAGELGLRSHTVSVEILDGVAKTTVEENFQNHTDRRLEGTFRFPLPPDASISRLALEVNGKIEEGTCLERERAREVFESIVRRMKDPALLEWMPGGIFQCRIFPIEPRATKRVIVAYTQALPYFRGRMTYVYPLASEKTKEHPPEELRIDVDVKLSGELKRFESPSHHLDVQRARPGEARGSFTARNLRPENDFVLTMETTDDELRVIPHKLDGDDGYFALFLTPRGAAERKPGRYAFVLDISASVTGPELEVARRVVREMMEQRIEGDRFEVIAHHVEVERSGEVDLRAANDFMDRLQPVGGCDLLKGLLTAPEECEIVYVGGGTPTYGETEASKILEAMKGRRVRSVAVGSRANLALLEKLGATTRISPNDSVGGRCVEIAATLGSPALSEIKVDGGEAIYDVVGVRDIHYGERLLVTGRYRGTAAKLVVTAAGGYRREIAAAFPAKSEGSNYVRRLWAQRKIADLLALPDKKAEITALGVKHQVMTPYTSFLVLENEQMWKDHQLQREVQKEDKVLGKAGSLEEFAARRMDKALTTSSAEVSSEAEALTRLIGGRTDGDAKKALETIEKFKGISVSQYSGRQRALPPADIAVVERKLRELGDDSDATHLRLGALSKVPETSPEAAKSRPMGGVGGIKGEPEDLRKQVKQIQMLSARAFSSGSDYKAKMDRLMSELEIAERSKRPIQDYDLQIATAAVALDPSDEWDSYIALPTVGGAGQVPKFGEAHGHFQYDFDLRGQGFDVREIAGRNRGGNGYGDEQVWNYPSAVNGGGDHFYRPWKTPPPPPSSEVFKTMTGGWSAEYGVQWDQHTGGESNQIRLGASSRIAGVPPPDIFTITTNVTVPGAPITDALPVTTKTPINGFHSRGDRQGRSTDIPDDVPEERLNHLVQTGVMLDVAPRKPLEGKTTAVANEIGLVVFSIGKDDGVMEGDEFTVYRGGDFVAKVQVDHADRKWSSAKVVLNKSDPRPGDDVSNHIYVSAPGGMVSSASLRADGLWHLSTEVQDTDGRTLTLKLGAQPGLFFAITRDRKFVAIVQITENVQGRSRGLVWRGVAVESIRTGDQAQVIADLGLYVAQLPEEAKVNLASRRSQQEMRVKLGY